MVGDLICELGKGGVAPKYFLYCQKESLLTHAWIALNHNVWFTAVYGSEYKY